MGPGVRPSAHLPMDATTTSADTPTAVRRQDAPMSQIAPKPEQPQRPRVVRYGLFRDAQEVLEWVKAERAKSPMSCYIHEKADAVFVADSVPSTRNQGASRSQRLNQVEVCSGVGHQGAAGEIYADHAGSPSPLRRVPD
jgi:hypothetical protein